MRSKSQTTNSSFFSFISDKEVETWVVNTVKVRMIKKLDSLLENEGCLNARKLLLVPIFSISELAKRVESKAPEMKTFFYKELVCAVDELENKL